MEGAPAGDNAILLDLGEVSAAELHRAAREVRAVDGVLACIIGHSSLYVIGPPAALQKVKQLTFFSAAGAPDDVRPRRIGVAFDGPDLAEFLDSHGLTREEFLARVATLRLTARYLGFRGGFAYLEGWPDEWSMPRRPTSRPLVPRGTFAIAGNVAGFYPIDTPGGWNLLGRTDENLENAFAPGDVIALIPSPRLRGEGQGEGPFSRVLHIPGVDILSAPLATIVNAPDYSRLDRGLPPGGPFDDIAAAIASSGLVHCETLIECAMVGPRLRFQIDATAAWCGPDLSARIDRVRAGDEVAIGRIEGGLRGYLAIGNAPQPNLPPARTERGVRNVIQAIRGPHDIGLTEVECEVTSQLDRVGVRLRPIRRIDVGIPSNLRSSGMQCGTVQLHPDGSMVAMGPDHPVTGGYLQPMTVITSERWKLAQLMPGERVLLRAQLPNA